MELLADPTTEGALQSGIKLPVNLPGCVAFNHCPESSSCCAGVLSYWNDNLNLTDTSRSSSSHAEIFPENYDIDEQFACQVAHRGPLAVKSEA
jgi:hypothetical protein